MNKSLKFFSIFLILNLFSGILFAKSKAKDDSEAADTSWYISEVNDKKEVKKHLRGPFNTEETAVANWLYLNLPTSNKYCISRGMECKTRDPRFAYTEMWKSLDEQFKADRDGFLSRFSIKKDNKVEKKYKEQLKKDKKNVKDSTISKTKYQKKEKKAEEPEPVEQEAETTEATSVTQETPAQEEPAASAPSEEILPEQAAPESEVLPAENTEAEKSEESETTIDLSSVPVTESTFKRYSKEYLQDYMLPEELPEPQDSYTEVQKIDNPDETDDAGQTLLMKAAKAGNEWQIKLLIDSGANMNLQDKDGWTALMYACRFQESLTTIEILLNAGADFKIKNNYELSALVIAACYNNNPAIIKKLLDYYYISDKEVLKSFVQLLSTKQTSEYTQIAKLNVYIDKSIMLNNFYEGKTPLMYAAQFGNSNQILKLLLDNGATTTFRSTEGKTAFDYARTNNNLKHDETYWSLNRK